MCDTPQVQIINVGRSIDSPSVVPLWSSYTFKARIELRCGLIKTKNMTWSLASPSLNSSEGVKSGIVVSTESDQWSVDESHIHLAYALKTLYLSVHVFQGKNHTEEIVYDKGYVKIILLPLVAIIVGETEITRGNTQHFILNASTSYDPHEGPRNLQSLKFHWLCRKSHEVFPTEIVANLPIISLNGSAATSGGCFDSGIGRLETTEPVVVLNASNLAESTGSYVFKIVVSKDSRTASDIKTVHVVEGNPPEVSMK